MAKNWYLYRYYSCEALYKKYGMYPLQNGG
jgi:hypothetical protein